MENGIVEVAPEEIVGKNLYIPHKAVIRETTETTYDASARATPESPSAERMPLPRSSITKQALGHISETESIPRSCHCRHSEGLLSETVGAGAYAVVRQQSGNTQRLVVAKQARTHHFSLRIDFSAYGYQSVDERTQHLRKCDHPKGVWMTRQHCRTTLDQGKWSLQAVLLQMESPR